MPPVDALLVLAVDLPDDLKSKLIEVFDDRNHAYVHLGAVVLAQGNLMVVVVVEDAKNYPLLVVVFSPVVQVERPRHHRYVLKVMEKHYSSPMRNVNVVEQRMVLMVHSKVER